MKHFEEPVFVVEKIQVVDVITASVTEPIVPGGGDGNVGGEIFD